MTDRMQNVIIKARVRQIHDQLKTLVSDMELHTPDEKATIWRARQALGNIDLLMNVLQIKENKDDIK